MKKSIQFKLIFAVLTVLAVIISGCSITGNVVKSSLCSPPYTEYKAGECCLDVDSDKICDSDEPEKEAAQQPEGSAKPEVSIGIINLLGDFEDRNIFNSMTFEIRNMRGTDIVNPTVSVKLLHLYPETAKKILKYSFEQAIPGTIKKGSASEFKIPIAPMEPVNPVVNREGIFELVVQVAEGSKQISNETETIIIGRDRSLALTSFPDIFEKSDVTKFSSAISIDRVKVSDNGEAGKSVTVTVRNSNGLKEPVVDVLIRGEHSFVFPHTGSPALSTTELPLSFKTHPEEPEYRPFEVYAQLRDGFSPVVYAQASKSFKLSCERNGVLQEFHDCTAVEAQDDR